MCQFFETEESFSFSAEQEQELVSLEREICAVDVALRPVVDADFREFAEIVHKRKDELHKLGKSSLEACLNIQHSRSDKDLTFCFNFLKRKKSSFSAE